MNGMLVMSFGAGTDDDLAHSFSFHHEFEPTSMICEVSLSAHNENDDEAGSMVGFSSVTFEDENGRPQDVAIDFASSRPWIAQNRLRRCEWYVRVYNANARGLFNAFFWDSVS
jgi:hypothetical protein